MTRLQKILIGLLIVQLVLAAVVLWPRGPVHAAAPLLGSLTKESVSDMTISDNTGISYHFQRLDDGWVLADRGNYPALGATVESLIENLLKIDTSRLVSQTVESHRQLKVSEEEFERKIVLKTTDGKENTLLLGTMTGMAANNIRLLPGDQVYLARDVSSYGINMTLSSWANNKLLSADTAKITAVHLVNKNGEFDFVRLNASEWQMNNLPAGEKFNSGTMTNMLVRAGSFSIDDVLATLDGLKPEYGLDNPQTKLTVKVEDDNPRTVTINLGNPTPDGKRYYASASDSKYVVLVNKMLAEHFISKTMADFIQQPTPVPAGTAKP